MCIQRKSHFPVKSLNFFFTVQFLPSASSSVLHSSLGTVIEHLEESMSPQITGHLRTLAPKQTHVFIASQHRGPQGVMFLFSSALISSEPYPSWVWEVQIPPYAFLGLFREFSHLLWFCSSTPALDFSISPLLHLKNSPSYHATVIYFDPSKNVSPSLG